MSRAVDDEIVRHADSICSIGLYGECDARIVPDVGYLPALSEVTNYDLVALYANPNDTYLRASIRVNCARTRRSCTGDWDRCRGRLL